MVLKILSSKIPNMKELKSYEDAIYLVKINGAKYLLKLHNGVESQSCMNEQSQKANSCGNISNGLMVR